MRTVTHREMRNNSGEILRAVAAGESIQVTNNGQIAAMISPPTSPTLDELVERGSARRARRLPAELSAIRRRKATTSSGDLKRDAGGRW